MQGDGQKLEMLARALDQLADAVDITDLDLRIVYVNPAFERLTEYSADEAIGQTPSALLRSDQHPERFFAQMEASVREGSTWRGRVRSLSKSGQPLVCDVVLSPLLDGEGRTSHFVAVRRDVTEQDRGQSQLMQSDRLAAVGHLAAGVAHEINNPLAYVLANTTFLREALGREPDPEAAEEIADALSDIEHGALRIRDIIKDLGAFSRPAEDNATAVDVAEVIDSSINLLANELRHRAQVVREYGEVPLVWGQRTRIGQVFLNLLLNAAQAIPIGAASDNQIRVRTEVDEDDCIVIEVHDTGEGIPADVLPKIFDPFFTTRRIGDGTGLGLSVAHTIVESMGGSILVASTPGRGSTFSVRLPGGARGAAVSPPKPSPAAARSSPARVLVVDDERGVLRAFERALRDHQLTTCESGREALEHLRAHDFDVVFCDLMMPEISGMELYQRVVAERPELAARFVFITGGAFTPEAQRFLAAQNEPALEKPFDAETLLAAIERVTG